MPSKPALPALALLLAAAAPAPAHASNEATDPFELGQIIVTARPDADAVPIGAQSVGQEALRLFGRVTLDDAARLIPGVSAGTTGGRRNERLVLVRGFNQFQAPLSIDGVRVHLPADNRLDFGRFLTLDIADVQVAKGYVSVLDGPDALGGAINLVTRQPARALEAEGYAATTLDRRAAFAAQDFFALVGTKQDRWFAQASGARRRRDHFALSADFTPTPIEDGGRRARSESEDWRMNAKIGFTPREGDAYTLSYTRQEGEKNAPLHVRDPIARQSNWRWPYWNVESLYFLSTTQLGTRATLKGRAYFNRFDNLLQGFDNASQTTQTLPRAFDSYYADRSWGGSAELGVAITPANRLAVAVHYRADEHREYQTLFAPARFTEPVQTLREDTWSIAAENTLALTTTLTFKAGVAFDWRDLDRAEDFLGNSPATGRFILYEKRDSSALNGQAALSWKPGEARELHASVSARSRFPSLFNRFSTAFNTAASNPDLGPERATNYEIGGSTRAGPVRIQGALFYSDVSDLIVALPLPVAGPAVTQSRNVGRADYYGAELAATATLAPTLALGGNYSWVARLLSDTRTAA